MSQTARGYNYQAQPSSSTAKIPPPSHPYTARASHTSKHSISNISSAPLQNGNEEQTSQPPAVDYSSTGASVEEDRAERYTAEFVRCLTPRSRAACDTEGILPRELMYRPRNTFGGNSYAATTAGVVAVVNEADPSVTNASLAIQQLRFQEYETSRLVALQRARTTRRRTISGLRFSLFGIEEKQQSHQQQHNNKDMNGTAPLPSVYSRSNVPSNANSHAALHHSHSHASHSRGPSLTQTQPVYPKGHELKEHPWFKAHPQHARINGLQTVGGANNNNNNNVSAGGSMSARAHKAKDVALPQALEWNALTAAGRGHLCVRMREHLVREQERNAWEEEQDRREARERRRQEIMENEWYQEQKIKMKKTKTAASKSSTGSSAEPLIAPRLTRAEMLRAAGANSLYLAQQSAAAAANASATGDATSAQAADGANAAGGGAGGNTRNHRSNSISQGGASNAALPLGPPTTLRQTSRMTSVESNVNVGNTGNTSSNMAANSSNSGNANVADGKGGNTSNSGQPGLSSPFSARVAANIQAVADRYSSFFEKEKQRVIARQETEIQRLAAAEKLRIELRKKQEDLTRKRAERAKFEKAKREAASEAAQKAREAKYTRVESEEASRVARIEAVLAAKSEAHAIRKTAREERIRAGIAERQSIQEEENEDRKWKMESAHHEQHLRLVTALKALHIRYEDSRERLRLEREQVAAERESKHELLAQKRIVAAQREMEVVERKYKLHLARTEKHANRDTGAAIRKANVIAQERAERAQEKAAHKEAVFATQAHMLENRAQAIMQKEERDNQRLAELQQKKQVEKLVMIEKKRLEEQRRQRNLERSERRIAFAQKQLTDKLKKDYERLQSIQNCKAEYAEKREEFAKHSFMENKQFKETYVKLRTAGAIAAIAREAKLKQREMDLALEEEKYER